MEKKKGILIIALLLCGCGKDQMVACSRYTDEDSLTLNLYGKGDDIEMIEVVEVFTLPEAVLADKKYYADLEKQLDLSCHMEENRLVRRYGLALDKTYSLSKTIGELEKQRYHCE